MRGASRYFPGQGRAKPLVLEAQSDRGLGERPSAVKRILLSVLRDQAAEKRPGYLERCLSTGKPDGDYVILDDQDWEQISRDYMGLGDKVHAFLKPIVGVVDKMIGTNLSNCRGCAARRKRLNRLGNRLRG